MRVLGIDPGTAIVGYSIIDNSKKKYDVLDYGCIFTEKDEDMPIRLEKIYDSLDEIVKRYKPTDVFFQKSEDGYKSWSGKRSDHACRTKK